MPQIVLAGSTGLIGQAVVQQLTPQQPATLLSRRALSYVPETAQVLITDFKTLELPLAQTADAAVICTLGTTIKTAGSQAAFKAVDLTLVVKLARAAHKAGYQQFLVISSLGTTPKTQNFYLQTKAEMEAAVSHIGFASVSIFRPSLLLGERDEFRFTERFAARLSKPLQPLFIGRAKHYLPIQAELVARALLRQAEKNPPGIHVIESEQIRLLATE